MPAGGVEAFRSSFARRSALMAGPGQQVVDRPGVCGVVAAPGTRGGRLLVTDDRALPVLRDLGPDLPVQVVNVFDTAAQSRALLGGLRGWACEEATAMYHPDLTALPVPALADGLTLRVVRRVAADPDDGVPLQQAAAACRRADPQAAGQPLARFLDFLRSLPDATRLLAAVDESGTVRATAGASALGPDANAYFVSTDPDRRHRGVATAMTAAALGWARDAGATQACLDASEAGASIYLRLGFAAVSATRLFLHFG